MGTMPLVAELPTMGCREVGLGSGPTSLCQGTPWAFCGALGDLESVGTAPGWLGARSGNLGLAEVASRGWLEQTKTPGSAVAR